MRIKEILFLILRRHSQGIGSLRIVFQMTGRIKTHELLVEIAMSHKLQVITGMTKFLRFATKDLSLWVY